MSPTPQKLIFLTFSVIILLQFWYLAYFHITTLFFSLSKS